MLLEKRGYFFGSPATNDVGKSPAKQNSTCCQYVFVIIDDQDVAGFLLHATPVTVRNRTLTVHIRTFLHDRPTWISTRTV